MDQHREEPFQEVQFLNNGHTSEHFDGARRRGIREETKVWVFAAEDRLSGDGPSLQ